MNATAYRRPEPNEYHEFYAGYVDDVPNGDIFELFANQIGEFHELLTGISSVEASKLHSPYTWTIKQVVGHLIDAEKIFGCRLHRFACIDDTPLPGMEQNPYVDNLDYTSVSLNELTDELEFTRRSNLGFLRRLAMEAWDYGGTVDGNFISVRALAYIMVGHIQHHLKIVRQRIGK